MTNGTIRSPYSYENMVITLISCQQIMKTIQNPIVEVAFQSREGKKIKCEICPHFCKLDEGGIGVCGGRQVIDGRFLAINYGQISSLQLDPIEKKPLYHYFPGSDILSVGPNGCNLTCEWCQNWQISQNKAPTRLVMPNELADMVNAVDGIGVAYTYAEPLIWFEYIRDAGRILHDQGLVNVFITNGYVNSEPLKQLLPIADAFNVDLKTIDHHSFRHLCGGNISDVQRNIRMIYDAGKHLELTHLVVSGVNDSLSKIEALVNWVEALDRKIPLHLSKYFPAHNFDLPPTDEGFIKEAYELAKSRLDNVFVGNTHFAGGQDSDCTHCGNILVKRDRYQTEIVGLIGDKCSSCGEKADIVVGEEVI